MIAHPEWTPGIDVAVWQRAIDWPRVAAAGVKFAICKADEGASVVDPTYAANVAGARAAGLVVGDYHFARPATAAHDAEHEADHFLATVGDRWQPGDLPPVLDIEASSIRGQRLDDWLWAWCERVRARLGAAVMVYTNLSYLAGLGATPDSRFAALPLWVAHYGVNAPRVPAPWLSWRIWQWGLTRVDGITGDVDANYFQGDESALWAWVSTE